MSRKGVFNAFPIILFSKIDAFDLLFEIFTEITIPEQVKKEILLKKEEKILRFLKHPKVKVKELKEIDERVIEWGLGKGESEVITMALKNPDYWVILDDRLGRKCAKTFGIKVMGTIGIIILAKKKGIIPEAKSIIKRLIDAGIYLSDAWISEIYLS